MNALQGGGGEGKGALSSLSGARKWLKGALEATDPKIVTLLIAILGTVLGALSTLKMDISEDAMDSKYLVAFTIHTVMAASLVLGLYWWALGIARVPWVVIVALVGACAGVYASVLVDAAMRHIDTPQFAKREKETGAYIRRVCMHTSVGLMLMTIAHP